MCRILATEHPRWPKRNSKERLSALRCSRVNSQSNIASSGRRKDLGISLARPNLTTRSGRPLPNPNTLANSGRRPDPRLAGLRRHFEYPETLLAERIFRSSDLLLPSALCHRRPRRIRQFPLRYGFGVRTCRSRALYGRMHEKAWHPATVERMGFLSRGMKGRPRSDRFAITEAYPLLQFTHKTRFPTCRVLPCTTYSSTFSIASRSVSKRTRTPFPLPADSSNCNSSLRSGAPSKSERVHCRWGMALNRGVTAAAEGSSLHSLYRWQRRIPDSR